MFSLETILSEAKRILRESIDENREGIFQAQEVYGNGRGLLGCGDNVQMMLQLLRQ